MITITLLCFPVDWETNSIYESDAVSYTAQILLCNLTNSANQTGSESDRDRESDRLGLRRGKASFPALCPDMAYLTCFSWSHCSRTVHENMKGRTTHGWEQWASLDTQTHTHTSKQKPLQYKGLCALAWVKACWQSVCVCLSMEAVTLLCSFPSCLSPTPLNLSVLFPPVFLTLLPFSLRNKRHSINFHTSPSPRQCHLSKEPQRDKRTKKKWNYWFDVSVN